MTSHIWNGYMKKKTSWQNSEKWYDKIVGEKGHYYHQNVIIPALLKEAHFTKSSKILDLGCGQGVLSRHLPEKSRYTGVDLSKSLLQKAKEYAKDKDHSFIQADICKDLPIKEKDFTHGVMILSLQNIEKVDVAIANLSKHLKKDAKLIIVINHPCFRIPRQSDWQIDEDKKIQSRRMNLYMSDQKIPIKTHPGKKDSQVTYSFHHPLCFYFDILFNQGFVVENILELCSDKNSTGTKAKMENRARKEFPLFLTFIAKKRN